MNINYFDCEFCDYNEFWDGVNEDRFYGCTHPSNCGVCEIDNKWGGEEADCQLLDVEGDIISE